MYNKQFLQELMEDKMRVLYARIISLNFDEQPLEFIEGKVTSGSVNIDGSSAVRRTCNLSLISETPLTEYFWTLNTKFKLAIGVENHIDSNYPEIIWFEQGVYLISSFSSSHSTNAYTVSISGKDKMCMLNGEVGGQFAFSVDFGILEQSVGKDDNGYDIFTKIRYQIKDIIREAVHTYGNEPFHNIIINDVQDNGLELEEYRYDEPLYLWRSELDNTYRQGTLYPSTIRVQWNNMICTLADLPDYGFRFDPLVETEGIYTADTITFVDADDKETKYYIAKIDYGETAGYKEIDLTYPDDLIMKAGENVTGLLDKIKKFLGDYEYFYNLDGQFVFQKKKTYLNTPWNPLNNDGEIDFSLQEQDQYSYIFNSTDKFTSINYTPNISNLKNDYVVWGQNRNNNPIHMRYSIHKKPFVYTSIKVEDDELKAYNKKYGLKLKGQTSQTYIWVPQEVAQPSYYYENGTLVITNVDTQQFDRSTLNMNLQQGLGQEQEYVNQEIYITLRDEIAVSDWREIIYQMSQDYRKYNHLDDFEVRIINANQYNASYNFKKQDNTPLYCPYSTGKTGYEQYYIDMDGFWRQLYNPWDGPSPVYISDKNAKIQSLMSDQSSAEKIKEAQQLIREVENFNEDGIIYYTYDEAAGKFVADARYGWTRNLIESPENLLFWIDFLDLQGELENISVPAIGMRTKTLNDDKVKVIYHQDTPEIIFYDPKDMTENPSHTNSAYRYFAAPDFDNMFSKSIYSKTAKEEIDNLLYNHGYCSETLTLTAIPIYYLEPNTRIFINTNDNRTGDYIISKITMPLQYNGTMQITATKAPKALY